MPPTDPGSRYTRRRFLQLSAGSAAAAVLAACTGTRATRGAPPGTPTLDRMARDLGTDVVTVLRRGHAPGRSGELMMVPKPWNVVAQWPGGLRGPRDPRTTHAAPWDYLMRVPVMLHGPGHIRPGEVSDRVVDVADLPPTFADLMEFEFDAPDGTVLEDALLPRSERNGPPRVIVLFVHDGGGWNLLEQWPRAWPTQRRLAAEGTTYVNATVGSAPPVTAPVHATMGAGAYPRVHRMAKNSGRLPDGSIDESFFHRGDPRLIEGPTLADAWSRATGHGPWVGLLGYDTWHLGMMGKGTRAQGGTRHVGVVWDREEMEFWTNEEIYTLPEYLPGRESLDRHLRELGAEEEPPGTWMGTDLGDDFFVPGTPAFVAHQAEALLEMLEREPVGDDPRTNLLFIEMKPSDTGGHLWNMLSPEVEAVLRRQDDVLASVLGVLDRKVGRGGYVVAVTADHGQSPRPDAVGALRIDRYRLQEHLNDRLGVEMVEAVHPDDLFLNHDVVRRTGIPVEDLARFVADVRFRDVAPEGANLADLPDEVLEDRVFAAVLPGAYVADLTEADVAALGRGRYPEGDLTSPVPRFAGLLES